MLPLMTIRGRNGAIGGGGRGEEEGGGGRRHVMSNMMMRPTEEFEEEGGGGGGGGGDDSSRSIHEVLPEEIIQSSFCPSTSGLFRATAANFAGGEGGGSTWPMMISSGFSVSISTETRRPLDRIANS
jgi:hypothetical protein